MPRTITFTINPANAEVKMEVDGAVGQSCTDATKPFVDALGGEVISTDLKPEFFQHETITETEVDKVRY